MTLSRNARRRLALYGSAAAVAVAALLAPRLVKAPKQRVRIQSADIEKARQDEATRLLVEYLRIDTSNPPGRTREAAAFWERLFSCEGMAYEVVGDDPERPIFVARVAGQRRDGALLLLHHMDVVPPGDLSKWSQPPFGGLMGAGVRSAYLVGRGSLDMKSTGIAYFLALAQLRRDGIVPERDVVFVGEPGEETFTPRVGIGWVRERRPDLLDGVTDVLTEGGTNECLADRIERFGIETLQKATVYAYADAREKATLEGFKRFLEKKMAEYPYRVSAEVEDFLSFIGPSRCDVWGRQMLDARAAVAAGRLPPEMPEVYQSLLRDMYYFGTIERRGTGYTMDVAAALLPGGSVEARWGELQRWAADHGLTLRLKFKTADSRPTPRTGLVWQTLKTSLELDPEQAGFGIYVLTGSYTNGSYLREHGYRVFGLSTFNVNFADALSIHSVDEKVNVVHFVEGVDRMKRILREWATAPREIGKEPR